MFKEPRELGIFLMGFCSAFILIGALGLLLLAAAPTSPAVECPPAATAR